MRNVDWDYVIESAVWWLVGLVMLFNLGLIIFCIIGFFVTL